MSNRHTISVTVESARGLRAADITGTSDPFAEVYIGDYRGKCRGSKNRTATMKHTLNPYWNQTFTFDISDAEASSSSLVVKVVDWDRFTRNDKLGYFVAPLSRLMTNKYQDDWFPMVRSLRTNTPAQGQVHLIISIDGAKPQPKPPGAAAAPYYPQYSAQPPYMGGGQQPPMMPMGPVPPMPQDSSQFKPNKYAGLGSGTSASWQSIPTDPQPNLARPPAGMPMYPPPPLSTGPSGYPGMQPAYPMGYPPMQPPPQQPPMMAGGYPYGGMPPPPPPPGGLGTPASYLPSGYRPM